MSKSHKSSSTPRFAPDYPLQGTDLDLPLASVVVLSPEKRRVYIQRLLTALAREIKRDTMSVKMRKPFKDEMRDLRKLLHARADKFLYTDEKTYQRNVLGKGSYGSSHVFWSRHHMWKMKTKGGDLAENIVKKSPALIRKLDQLLDQANRSKEGFRNYGKTTVQNVLFFLQVDRGVGTAFPPHHAKFFADRYLPKDGDGIVFDPCAGWGGRLLGSLCVNRTGHVQYYGVDPEKRNKDAYEGLERRINVWLKRELTGTRSATLYYRPFEVFIKTRAAKKLFGRCDLVMTSPPYFDAEIYNPLNAKQSSNKYATYEQWRTRFYRPLMKGAFDLLKAGGVCVLNIANVSSAKSLEKDARILAREVGFQSEAFFKMALTISPGTRNSTGKAPRHSVMVNGKIFKQEPCFVFRKSTTKSSRQRQVAPVSTAQTAMLKASPSLHHKSRNKWKYFALTPVQQHDGYYFKRDDLYQPFPDFEITGGKVRQCLALIESNLKHIKQHCRGTIATAVSAHSPQGPIVARLAKAFGLKCVICVGTDQWSKHRPLQMCKEYGAEVIGFKNCGRPNLLQSRFKQLFRKKQFFEVNFGFQAATDADSILGMNAHQVKNLPKTITKLVIPVGSGVSAEGIVQGVAKHRPDLLEHGGVVLIQPFGYERRIAKKELRVKYYKGKYPYATPKIIQVGDVELDHIYEAKAFEYMRSNLKLKGEQVCFWIVGNANALRK